MFSGMPDLFGPMMVMLAITVPLGLWKVIDIIVWLCRHIHLTIK